MKRELALRHPGQVGFDNALGCRMSHQTGGIVNIQFIHDLGTVLLDSFNAQTQFGGNLFVGKAFCDKLQTSASRTVNSIPEVLAAGISIRLRTFARADAGRWRTEEGVPFFYLTNRLYQVGSRGLFDKVSGRPGGDGLLDVFFGIIGRQHHDFG